MRKFQKGNSLSFSSQTAPVTYSSAQAANEIDGNRVSGYPVPNISGMRNRDLRRFLSEKTCTQVSRTLKRLRVHGLLKRAG